MNRIIRTATLDDATDVVQAFRGARGEMRYLPHLHAEHDDAEFLLGLIWAGHLQVVESGGKVVGFMVVRNGWLDHLYVAPEHQNKGHGRVLLTEAKKLGRTGLKLWVFEANTRAAAFYERNGFGLRGRRDAATADNEEGLADRLYEWQPRSAT